MASARKKIERNDTRAREVRRIGEDRVLVFDEQKPKGVSLKGLKKAAKEADKMAAYWNGEKQRLDAMIAEIEAAGVDPIPGEEDPPARADGQPRLPEPSTE